MTSDKARKDAVRQRMAETEEPYSVAARALRDQSATAVIDPALLAPYPDEEDVKVEELGWRVLPPDATPQQRAHAEAVWRPVAPERPCRCSGPCHHGTTCDEEVFDEHDQAVECGGRMIHVDRRPGSLFSLTMWVDFHQCDSCNTSDTASVDLPAIPWGEVRPRETEATDAGQTQGSVTVVYSGVRHPNFPDFDEDAPEFPEGDGHCRACGGYAHSGLLCDGCRAEGWSDSYGILEEPDPDPDEWGCPECGAGGGGDPYEECMCG